MAVYKVLQDIEAEDKLVGPLSLRQFIYAAIAGVLIFINFRLFISYDLGFIRWIFILLFSLPMILFGVLAAPLGRDQPTELWLLSHIKFLLSPRQRTWDQGATVQSVTITAPKKTEKVLAKNLSQTEVKSRLQALASLLDSRGWSVQTTPLYQPESPSTEDNDRLVSREVLSKPEPVVDIRAGDDLLDEQSNATAQRYGALVKEVEEQKKEALAKKLRSGAKADNHDNWGIENIQPQMKAGSQGKIIHPDNPQIDGAWGQEPEESEVSLEERLKAAEKSLHASHPSFSPASPLAAERLRRAQKRMAATQSSSLASNGNFSVATIASLANRGNEPQVPI